MDLNSFSGNVPQLHHKPVKKKFVHTTPRKPHSTPSLCRSGAAASDGVPPSPPRGATALHCHRQFVGTSNDGIRMGTIAFMRCCKVPESSCAPRAFCAFMILSVSSIKVGIGDEMQGHDQVPRIITGNSSLEAKQTLDSIGKRDGAGGVGEQACACNQQMIRTPISTA